jgi:hypothetical protein
MGLFLADGCHNTERNVTPFTYKSEAEYLAGHSILLD